MTTTEAGIEWVRLGRDYYRSKCGRFDLLDARLYWVAIDGDAGKVFRASTRMEVAAWCGGRQEGTR